jgi:hypothetical protein
MMMVRKSQQFENFKLNSLKFNVSVHGSQASLLSGGSSLYGSTEERQATEVRRLKRELMDARDQVCSLSGQLSANVSTINKLFKQTLVPNNVLIRNIQLSQVISLSIQFYFLINMPRVLYEKKSN